MSVLSEAFGVGSLPAGWETSPLHAVATERRGNRNDGLVEENLLSLSYGSIVRKDINSDGGLLPESFEGYQIVEAGDLVMRLTDLQNDKRSLRSGLCNERGIITSAYLALEPTGIEPRYFAYLMRAYDTAKVLYPLGGGLRQSLKFEDVRMLPVLVPPVEEQRRIADFLDDQVSRIDALVNLRRQNIKLLGERRQSAMSAIVTGASHVHRKAPEPTSQAKVEGPLSTLAPPEGWVWGTLGYLAPRVAQDGYGNLEPLSVYLGAGVVRRADRDDNLNALGSDLDKYLRVLPGDLVFNKLRTWQGGLGASRYEGIVSPAYYVLRPGPLLDSRFVHYLLVSSPYLSELTRLSKFMPPSQFDISWDSLKRLPILVPPVREQIEIAKSLDEVLESVGLRITVENEGVDLLEERKRALITAAVTGELDVTTAKPIGMGKWVPNVGAGVESPAAAEASSIGGIG